MLIQQIFIVFSVDLSLLLHPLARRLSLCDGWKYSTTSHHHNHDHHHQYDANIRCSVNLCQVMHEGGEGILFPAKCWNSTTIIPALHKYVKVSSGRTAYHEIRATQRLADCSKTLRVLDGGLNYLTMTHLVDYGRFRPPQLTASREEWSLFLGAYLQNIGDQLDCLHRANYLHRDVYNLNILMKEEASTTEEQKQPQVLFQLIDTSSSVPMDAWETAVKPSLRARDKHHLSIPPALVCRLSHPSRGEQQYCASISFPHPCLEWLDRYTLGVQALRMLYREITGNDMKQSTRVGLESLVNQHQTHVEALRIIQDKHRAGSDGVLLNRIRQLVLWDNQNGTSCH